MDTFYVVLGLCLVAGVYAQEPPGTSRVFYDNGLDIFAVVDDDFNNIVEIGLGPSPDRLFCNIGDDIYSTADADILLNNETIPFITGSNHIFGFACSCNFIATASYDDDGNTIVDVTEVTETPGITISNNLGTVGEVSLEFFRSDPDIYLIAVSSQILCLYDVDNITEGHVARFDVSSSLLATPRCVASYFEASTGLFHSFVTFDTTDAGQIISFDTSGTREFFAHQVPVGAQGIFPDPGDASCVAIEEDFVYYTAQDPANNDLVIVRYPIADLLNQLRTIGIVLNFDRDANLYLLPVSSILTRGSLTNGLSVLGQNAFNDGSCAVTCTCEGPAPICGICYIGGSGTCQCDSPLISGCVYNDQTLADSCFVPVPRLNACCMVKNPVAFRRTGDAIEIVGVTTDNLAADIVVRRVARTGRWLLRPISTDIDRNNGALTIQGISSPVQQSSRGRRFGVFEVEFTPVEVAVPLEAVPCIATENSGFLNTIFTVTVSQDEGAALRATFSSRLQRFMGNLEWLHTDSSGNTDRVRSCDGRLMCALDPPVDPGIYEVYRRRRYLRTWHPLFFVLTRICDDGLYGPTCERTCPNCVYGVCDDLLGLCNCYPGFVGDDCSTSCPEGTVGANCDITCGEVFGDSTDCSNLLICCPGKVGCACYPGLRAPECRTPCEDGFWGSNCANQCTNGLTCDKRTGVLV